MSAAVKFSAIRRCLERGVDRGVFPGVAAVVGSCDELLFEGAAGTIDGTEAARPATLDTIYDVASLTKPLVTVSCLIGAFAAGSLSLDTTVAELLPLFARNADAGRRRVSVADLLFHRSGLPAWQPYFAFLAEEESRCGKPLAATLAGRRRIEELAAAEPMIAAAGTAECYSDVGYILLGAILQRSLGIDLTAWTRSRLCRPLGLSDSGFVDLACEKSRAWRPPAERTAPCGICLWRGRQIRGVVQDENAYAMGGVAGHAGWFGTAREVFLLAQQYLASWLGRSSLFEPDLVRRLWATPLPGRSWTGGWDTPSPEASSAGSKISQRAVGHLGFTGGSIWIDLERELIVVVLSNRVHPERQQRGIAEWRPSFHDAVFGALG